MVSIAKKSRTLSTRTLENPTSSFGKHPERRGSPTDARASKTVKRRLQRRDRRGGGKVEVNTALLSHLLSTDLGLGDDLSLYSDDSVAVVESKLLRASLLKKFKAGTPKEAEASAIQSFLDRNAACGTWAFESSGIFDELIDGEFTSIVRDCLQPHFDSCLTLTDIASGWMQGPGAGIDCEENDFLTKVSHSPLSCTDLSLYDYYRHAIPTRTWAAAERQRHAQYGTKVVWGNKLSTVNKNVEKKRVICTEPPLNMFFQQGIGTIYEDCLAQSFGIHIGKRTAQQYRAELQPDVNRRLARLGSMTSSREGFCTIDLADASNCVSVRLCEQKLPVEHFRWLMRTRSPYTILPGGERVKLEMMSSMGNAFTFPLQTILFASIVKACYRVLGIPTPRCDSKEPTYGVFGDDIVCVKDAYEVVARALTRYGFTVNDGKSFSSGNFRESCGGDFWCGLLVRGVYIQELNTRADVYSTINRLVRWSVRSGVALDLTLWYLLGLVKFQPIPFQEGDTSGVKVPLSLWQPQAYDLATRSPIYRAMRPRGRSYAAPTEDRSWRVGKDGHLRSYNADGCLLALLGGFIRDGRVGIPETESTTPDYHVQWCTVPNWDHISLAEALLLRGADWVIGADKILRGLG